MKRLDMVEGGEEVMEEKLLWNARSFLMRKPRDIRYKIGRRVIRLQSFSLIVPLVLLFMLAACGSTTTTGAGSTPTSEPGSGATTVPGKATAGCPNRAVVTPVQKVPNVTLHVANSTGSNSAHQGDLIEVQLPFGRQWSGPTTSQGALELQSPYGYANDTLKMCIWQFVAKGAGTVHLNFSGRPICLPGQLCPQYIQYVPFIIEVK